jgi:hypothetical protein
MQYLLLIGLAAFHLTYGLLPAWNDIHSDFPNYYVASRLLVEGQDVRKFYDDEWFNAKIHHYGIEEDGKFSSFPPPTVFVMLPFANFDPLTAKRLWTLCNLIFLAGNVWLLKRITNWSYLWSCNFVLLCGFGLANNIRLGQLYLAMSALVLLSYALWQKERPVTAGALLGLAAAIKYFPLIYLAGFAFHRKWKVVVSGLATVATINLIGIIVLGWGVYRDFVLNTFFPHLNGVLSSQTPYAAAFQSWNSLLRKIFVYDAALNPEPLINQASGFVLTKTIITALILGWAVYILYRVQKHHRKNAVPIQLAVLGITALLLLPASATYHFLFLIFPAAILLASIAKGPAQRFGWLIVGCYLAIGFVPLQWFYRFEGQGAALLLAYPRLWLMSLLFVVTLWAVHLDAVGGEIGKKSIAKRINL